MADGVNETTGIRQSQKGTSGGALFVKLIGDFGGVDKKIATDSSGALLQVATINGLIIEAPGVNTERDLFEGTLAGAATLALPFVNVTTAYEILVENDSALARVLEVRLNGEATGKPVKGGEKYGKSIYKFTSLSIFNRSGSTIDFRIEVSGV